MASDMVKYALIVAAGQGTRAQVSDTEAQTPKQFRLLGGKPVLQYSIEAFASAFPDIQFILVLPAVYPDFVGRFPEIFTKHPFAFAIGGETRFHSVKNGLSHVQKPDAVVFVHDAARPVLSAALIRRCYEAALMHGTAIPCVPAVESLRMVDAQGRNYPLDRHAVKYIQTPQTFRASLLLEAFHQSFDPSFTDEATVVEKAGYPVQLVEGEPANIKLTYPQDFAIAEILLRNRSASAASK
ncbi:IspD/TarI family cytidylyltransferase [Thermoflavifilum thermophilum]|uniref:2-C-methyl-D-erythritol 4-phosphate cytidylyltransferase n=1 Tax=Thermoflavifilum thermophilum TaxID=1393122 RepID=A0A1I7NFN6_9BACT|nr:2-C-methyl-D-erythritol 4-phosphate cytidylyltransferase [Thermoflavifilum thermophilum]SFV33487.1 2-C-methyl-D-erythritol 4-phosphate cytidylyltransferase [Thermoflavifilum thermophilum]